MTRKRENRISLRKINLNKKRMKYNNKKASRSKKRKRKVMYGLAPSEC